MTHDPLGLFDDEAPSNNNVGADPLGLFEGVSSSVDASQIPAPLQAQKPAETEKPSLLGRAWEMYKGFHEIPLTLATGAAAAPLGVVGGGIAALNDLAAGREPDFRKSAEGIASDLTYIPRSEGGQDILEAITPILEGLQAFGPTGYGTIPHALATRRAPKVVAEAPKEVAEVKFKPRGPEPKVGEQLSLDLELPAVEPSVKPAEAGAGPVLPERGGMLSEGRRQMELSENTVRAPERIDVDTLGEAVRSDTPANDLFARDAATQRVRADLDAQLESLERQKASGEGSPMERMAQQLGAEEGLPPIDEPTIQRMARDLERFEYESKARPIQEALEARQQQLDFEVGRQAIPEMMARERARQEAAPLPVPSPKQVAATRAAAKEVNSLADRGITIEQSPTGFVAMRNGQQVGKLDVVGADIGFNPETAKLINEPASVDIVSVDPSVRGTGVGRALYQAMNDAYGGNIRISGKTTSDAWKVWKRDFPDKVDNYVKDEVARINSGADTDLVVGNITDPEIAQRVMNALPPSAKAPTIDSAAARLSSQRIKQGGFIKLPFGKGPVKKAIPNIEERFADIIPDTMPVEEFVTKYKNAPDVGKKFDQLTASGLYLNLKYNHPLIKRVTDRGKAAVNTSRAIVRDVVHDSYAPAWRALSNEELIKVHKALDYADRHQMEIDMDSLKAAGWSDKAIQVVRQHQSVMNTVAPLLKETADIYGIKGVQERVGYAAMNLQGDFQKIIRMESTNDKGELVNSVVGVLGGRTRRELNAKIARYLQENPRATAGDEFFIGGTSMRENMGFQQLMQRIADNDPAAKSFIDQLTEAQSAEKYLGSEKHTKGKKGVVGTTGRDPYKSDLQNARDFAKAQVDYATNVIRWNEMSKFVQDAKQAMEGLEGQPNAKQVANNYIDQLMGRGPGEIGRAVDAVENSIGKATGLGTTIGKDTLRAVRKVVGAKLLGLNPMFLATNIIQPFRASPEMTQFLASKGVSNLDPTGLTNLANAFAKMTKMELGGSVDGITKGAMEYAQKNHVFSSELFETSNRVRKDFGYRFEHVTQVGAQEVERVTRKAMFLSFVEQLHEGGLSPKSGLYEASHNLTDMAMANYNERAPIYSQGGSLGESASYLMTYKHNELSRLALFARGLPDTPTGRALGANLMAQVATAGAMGVMGYQEADWLVRRISEKMGKPTSLTQMLLEHPNEYAKLLAYGPLSTATGVDFTGRLGLDVMPQSGFDAVMPGITSIGKGVGAAASAITNPTEFNVKNAVRENVPLGFAGMADREWFSRPGPGGEEFSINRNTGMKQAERNEADKLIKSIGGTGVHESAQSKLNWEHQQTDKWYDTRRKEAITDMRKAMFTNEGKQRALSGNKDFQDAVKKYVEAQGNMENFDKTIESMAMSLNLSPAEQQRLRDAGSRSITSIKRLERNSRGTK